MISLPHPDEQHSAPSASGRVMKLLYVIDTLEVGGTERSLLETVRRLDRRRFDPEVVTLYPGLSLQPEFAAAGVPVHALRLPGKYSFPQGIRRLRELLRQLRPDLVHSMLFRANQIARLATRSLNIPLINSLVNVPYDPERFAADPQLKRWKNSCIRLLDRATSALPVHYHAVSETVKNSYCCHLGISPGAVTVIPRGRTVTETAVTSGSDLRAACGISEQQRVLLCVGRLIPQKGHRTLLAAMPEILARHPAAVLVCVGDGPLREELTNLSRELGLEQQVRFLGQRDDVPRWLAAADLFVLASHYEGLPGAVIEAMLAGLPIVASDIPQLRELITDEETGKLVPMASPGSLADAVAGLLSDTGMAARYGAAAARLARERYDMRHVIAQLESLYSRMGMSGLTHPAPNTSAVLSEQQI